MIDDKLKTHYAVKATPMIVTDIDEGSRKVKGYFSSFDTIDSDMDVIRKGSFTKSLQERGIDSTGNRKIAHLRNHDWEHQIGKLIELSEDSKGLMFVSELGRSTKANDALLDYQDGILREHSIGFNYIKDRIKEIKGDEFGVEKAFEITELKLWEGSAVTFGANSLTPVIDVAKSEGNPYAAFEELNKLSEKFFNAIKGGNGTDKRLENIEAMFKQIQQLQQTLILQAPSIKDTLVKEAKPSAYHKSLIKLLTKN